jgi:excisionase family DNA binding protein
MDLLSTIQVAERLGVDDSTVRLWCRQGLLEAQQVGGSWVISSNTLAKFKPPKMGRPSTKAKPEAKPAKRRGRKAA